MRNVEFKDSLSPSATRNTESKAASSFTCRRRPLQKRLLVRGELDRYCLIFTVRLLPCSRDRRRNWPRTERRQKVSDAKSRKSVRSALQNTVGRVSRSRDLFLFGLGIFFYSSHPLIQMNTQGMHAPKHHCMPHITKSQTQHCYIARCTKCQLCIEKLMLLMTVNFEEW